jgi:hypothetical protein
VIVLVLMLAGATALVITGIVKDDPATAIFGGVLLAFLLWATITGGSSGDDDWGDAGDGDAWHYPSISRLQASRSSRVAAAMTSGLSDRSAMSASSARSASR